MHVAPLYYTQVEPKVLLPPIILHYKTFRLCHMVFNPESKTRVSTARVHVMVCRTAVWYVRTPTVRLFYCCQHWEVSSQKGFCVDIAFNFMVPPPRDRLIVSH